MEAGDLRLLPRTSKLACKLELIAIVLVGEPFQAEPGEFALQKWADATKLASSSPLPPTQSQITIAHSVYHIISPLISPLAPLCGESFVLLAVDCSLLHNNHDNRLDSEREPIST